MSNFDFNKLREQCRITGTMLRENFKGSDNHLISISHRDADPIYHNTKLKGIQQRTQSKDWQAKQKEKGARLSADPKWQEKQTQRNKKMAQDPKWIESNNKGVEKRLNDPKWNKNVRKALRQQRAKPCITPLGIFATVTEAGDAYNLARGVTNGNNAVCNKLKKGTEGYRYISVEEYIMLTGKEI
jgi:hypothetical protein